MGQTDTIAAIATALTDSGIGIVRISGPDAAEAADRILRNKRKDPFVKQMQAGTIRHGYLGAKETLDEVLVSLMRAPVSYTGEDTVEINCHGGAYVVRRALREVLDTGLVRLAEPGEFTKRAFLNGKMDLSEAEAVADLIASRSEAARSSAAAQLTGLLSGRVRRIREEILYETAFLESALDDPEHFSLEGYGERLREKITGLLPELERMMASYENGRFLKEGIRTVIMGKPNVGKSSVMNLLLGSERAIVTEIAGTTRDTLEEYVTLGQVTLRLIDTAGLRDTKDPVERIGVDRARKALEEADLVLFVIDGSSFLEAGDMELFPLVYGKRCVILCNKADLGNKVPEEEFYPHFVYPGSLSEEDARERYPYVAFSAKSGEGLDRLQKILEGWFYDGTIASSGEPVITSLRHLEALSAAAESLRLVLRGISAGVDEDLYTVDLMNAYTELGKIIGESVEDDLVDEIFSRFCMGK